MTDARPRTDGLRENRARDERVEYTKPAHAAAGGNRATRTAAVKPKYQDAALVEAFADLVDPVPSSCIPAVRAFFCSQHAAIARMSTSEGSLHQRLTRWRLGKLRPNPCYIRGQPSPPPVFSRSPAPCVVCVPGCLYIQFGLAMPPLPHSWPVGACCWRSHDIGLNLQQRERAYAPWYAGRYATAFVC
jgi:hypothetical protein